MTMPAPSRLTLALLLAAAAPALAEQTSTLADQTALAVTIYNDDLALIKDARKVKLGAGEQTLAWREVSSQMQPETALLRSLDNAPLTLLEQNFDFDLLTPRKLLEKSVGESVRVMRTQPITGAEFSETATLRAANDGVVLQFADRVEGGVPGRIAFAGIPPGLRDRPTLSMLVRNAQPGNPYQAAEYGLELSYLTSGLGWKADYVAELAADDNSLDLSGWVTLSNRSGTAYPNARLQLVAGTVNRAPRDQAKRVMAERSMALADAAAPAMQTEALFEYHLYTLERPTSLNDNQTKQVALLSAPGVAARKEYRLQGGDWYYLGQHGDLGRKLKPSVSLAFDNRADAKDKSAGGLGVALPKGVVRVYKRDSQGRVQFIGEDRIEHTAKGETVRLNLGEVFDITADKTQTDFQRLGTFSGQGGVVETAYRLEIRNAKAEAVNVKVVEPMPGDWQITQSSHPHAKAAAHTATWDIPVKAEGKTTLTWRVRVKY